MLTERQKELLAKLEPPTDEEVILEILERRHDIEIELRVALKVQDKHLKRKVRQYTEQFLRSLQELSIREIDLRDANQQALFELSYGP